MAYRYDYSGTNPAVRMPASLKDEFEAAKEFAVGVMRGLSGKGRVVFRRIDDGIESDPVHKPQGVNSGPEGVNSGPEGVNSGLKGVNSGQEGVDSVQSG
jgi:hypothetical protein